MAEVRLEVELAHPPERVWRALTEARMLGEWFMPTDLEPREGSRFTLDPGTLAGFLGPVSGELTELAPPHRMVMLWQGEKLHTRVTWRVTATAGGCRVQVVQTGFIGAPAALRRRALRDTYTRMFAEQLPGLLDRVAAGTAGFHESPGGAAAVRTAVPRQRRPHANVAVSAWLAGRTLGPPPATAPEQVVRAEGLDDAGQADAVAVAEPAAGGSGRAPDPPEPGPRRVRKRQVLRPELRETAPAWLRAVAITGAAGVLALTVLAVLSYPSGRDTALGEPPGGADGSLGGPGVALRPGAATSHTGPAGTPGAASPGTGPDRAPGEAAGIDPTAGTPGALLAGAGQPESTAAPGSTPAGPVLTARLTTSGMPLLGGRAGVVTVSNPGPGAAAGWEVTMDVGDQAVSNIAGAAYHRDGSVATFTPLAEAVEAGELAAGDSTEFSFDITAPVLGLIGASDPTDCMINGQPCG